MIYDNIVKTEDILMASDLEWQYDVPVFSTYMAAVNARDTLAESMHLYEIVTVADLRDCAGLPASYVDNKYGWCAESVNVRGVSIADIGGGYILKLPKPLPIE